MSNVIAFLSYADFETELSDLDLDAKPPRIVRLQKYVTSKQIDVITRVTAFVEVATATSAGDVYMIRVRTGLCDLFLRNAKERQEHEELYKRRQNVANYIMTALRGIGCDVRPGRIDRAVKCDVEIFDFELPGEKNNDD